MYAVLRDCWHPATLFVASECMATFCFICIAFLPVPLRWLCPVELSSCIVSWLLLAPGGHDYGIPELFGKLSEYGYASRDGTQVANCEGKVA